MSKKVNQQDAVKKIQYLNTKIQELFKTKNKCDQQIKDMIHKLIINKSTIKIILSDTNFNTKNSSLETLKNLATQNQQLITLIQDKRKFNEEINAQRLIQQQVNQQQKQYFDERIRSLQQRIDQLRKLMHDKQHSFTNVIDKLNAYQQINENELFVQNLSENLKKLLQQYKNRNLVSKYSHQKGEIERNIQNMKNQLSSCQRQINSLFKKFKQKCSYTKIKSMACRQTEILSQGDQTQQLPETQIVEIKENKNGEIPQRHITKIQKQLVRLLKKQKQTSIGLSVQFKQSMQIGKQLKNIHNKLIQKNKSLEKELISEQNRIKQLTLNLSKYRFEKKIFKGKRTFTYESRQDIMFLSSRQEIKIKQFKEQSTKSSLKIKCGSQPGNHDLCYQSI